MLQAIYSLLVIIIIIIIWKATTSQQEIPQSSRQKDWVKHVYESTISVANNDAPLEEKATLAAAADRHSGAWLNAVPIQQNGLCLTNEELRIRVCIRLGLKMCLPQPCVCGASIDAYGTHCFTCKRNSGKNARHSMMNELLKHELTKCQIPSRLEPSGLSGFNGLRPDGVTCVPWSRGQPVAWDFTCVHTLCASHLRTTQGLVGEAARRAEAKKTAKYALSATDVSFRPLAVESLGVLGPSAAEFITDLGRRQIDALKDTRAASLLLQRFSLQLQRGNTMYNNPYVLALIGRERQTRAIEDARRSRLRRHLRSGRRGP